MCESILAAALHPICRTERPRPVPSGAGAWAPESCLRAVAPSSCHLDARGSRMDGSREMRCRDVV